MPLSIYTSNMAQVVLLEHNPVFRIEVEGQAKFGRFLSFFVYTYSFSRHGRKLFRPHQY